MATVRLKVRAVRFSFGFKRQSSGGKVLRRPHGGACGLAEPGFRLVRGQKTEVFYFTHI